MSESQRRPHISVTLHEFVPCPAPVGSVNPTCRLIVGHRDDGCHWRYAIGAVCNVAADGHALAALAARRAGRE